MKKYLFIVSAFLLMVSVALPQSDIGLKSVGGKIGYIMPEDPIESTLGFGIAADLGTITPAIHLGGFFEYWSKSYDISSYSYKQEWSWSEFIFGATAKYYFKSSSNIKPYAGAGLNFIIGKWSWEASGFGDDSESETDIGFHFCGGVEHELSPTLNGFAEAKYTIDGADHFGIYVGVMYKMDKK